MRWSQQGHDETQWNFFPFVHTINPERISRQPVDFGESLSVNKLINLHFDQVYINVYYPVNPKSICVTKPRGHQVNTEDTQSKSQRASSKHRGHPE